MALESRSAAALAALAGALAITAFTGCGSDDTVSDNREASVSGIKPIERIVCPERTGSEAFFGNLRLTGQSKTGGMPVWLMSSDVDCDQWSGPSNPTKMAKVGPTKRGLSAPEGWKNPFRLEARGTKPWWRIRIVTKGVNGQLAKLFSFRVGFVEWPKKSSYRGLFLCFGATFECRLSPPRECPPNDFTAVNCGYPPGEPKDNNNYRVWTQRGNEFIFGPSRGDFGPFLVSTFNKRNTETKTSSFELSIEELYRRG